MRGLGYGALSSSFTPIFSHLTGQEAGRATLQQHYYNISLCHNITARWKVGFSFYFQKETSESMKGVLRERESVVCETAA